MAKHLTYPFLVGRRRLLRPWSRADVLLQVIYLTINILCLTFRVSSVKEAGARARTIAMINMTPLFFGFHLSFLANILEILLIEFPANPSHDRMDIPPTRSRPRTRGDP